MGYAYGLFEDFSLVPPQPRLVSSLHVRQSGSSGVEAGGLGLDIVLDVGGFVGDGDLGWAYTS